LKKYTTIPALTGKQLINLLKQDGWKVRRRATHGLTLTKRINNQTLVTFVPDTTESLRESTLGQILSVKQTRFGKKGLLELLNINTVCDNKKLKRHPNSHTRAILTISM